MSSGLLVKSLCATNRLLRSSLLGLGLEHKRKLPKVSHSFTDHRLLYGLRGRLAVQSRHSPLIDRWVDQLSTIHALPHKVPRDWRLALQDGKELSKSQGHARGKGQGYKEASILNIHLPSHAERN